MSNQEKLKELVKAAAGGTLNADQIIEICDNTLKTAREIRALLEGLDLGYKEALENLKNLEKKLDGKINDFFEKAKPIEEQLQNAVTMIDEMTKEIEALKPQIAKIKELADRADQSLIRLEEINENVIQIEQRIKDLLAKIDIDAVEREIERIYATFERNVKKLVDDTNFFIQSTKDEMNRLIEQANEKIKELTEGLNNLSTTLKQEIQELGDKIKKEIEDLGNTKKQEITNAASNGVSSIQSAVSSGKTDITNHTNNKKNEITSLANNKKNELINKGDEILDKINRAGGGSWVKTMETISEESVVWGVAWQEVMKNSQGEIVKYGDLFVRGYKVGTSLGTGDATGYRPIPTAGIEHDLFLIVAGNVLMRPRKGQGYDNSIFVFGENTAGMLGTGDTNYVGLPTEVRFNSRVKQFGYFAYTSENQTSVVLLENGEIWMSGKKSYNALADGKNSPSPNFEKCKIDNVEKMFSAGYSGRVVKLRNGQYKAWGYNENTIFGFDGAGPSDFTSGEPIYCMHYDNAYGADSSYMVSLRGTDLVFSGDNRYGTSPNDPSKGIIKNSIIKDGFNPFSFSPALGDTMGGELCLIMRAKNSDGGAFFALGRGAYDSKSAFKRIAIPYCDGVVITKRGLNKKAADSRHTYIFSKKDQKKLWRVKVLEGFKVEEVPLPQSFYHARHIEIRQFCANLDVFDVICLIIEDEIWVMTEDGYNRGNNTDNIWRFNLLRRG